MTLVQNAHSGNFSGAIEEGRGAFFCRVAGWVQGTAELLPCPLYRETLPNNEANTEEHDAGRWGKVSLDVISFQLESIPSL